MASDLGKDLRTFLLANATVATKCVDRVHQNVVPEDYAGTYIWFARSGITQQKGLTDTNERPFTISVDLEIYSFAVDDVEALAEAVHLLDGSRGTIGEGTMQGLFVEDHTDDYQPRGVGADEGLFTALLKLTIHGYVPG